VEHSLKIRRLTILKRGLELDLLRRMNG
jgi:hypothetical protein